MKEIFLNLSPIILTYLLGIVLRAARVVDRNDGAVLLRIVFYVAIPALILHTVPHATLTADLAYLPLVAAAVILGTFAAAFAAARRWAPERATFGTALVGAMIMNTSFILPFVLVVYGDAGFATAIIFDTGNAFLVATVVLYTAFRYGGSGHGPLAALRRVALAPPLWAVAAGLLLNFTGARVPPLLDSFLVSAGNLMVPLVMLSLGIYFTPRLERPRLLISVLVIRSVGGLALALLCVQLLNLQGLTRSVVLASGAAPVGFNTLVFASLAKLDVDFAASLLSISIALGIVLMPVLMVFLR